MHGNIRSTEIHESLQKRNEKITHSKTKRNIQIYMRHENISLNELSHKSGMGKMKLFNMLHNPFCKVKMTQGVAISKVMKRSVSELLLTSKLTSIVTVMFAFVTVL